MTSPPPDDPLADPRPLVTRAELDRLARLRRDVGWYDRADARTGDELRFALDLVDRLLGRATLPGEDPYPPDDPTARYDVRAGPSLYMCGHGDWHVRVRGRPGIVLSFTAGPLDAARLRDLLTPLDRYRAALDDLGAVVARAQDLDEAGDSPGYETAHAVRAWRDRLLAALDDRAGEDGR